MWSKVCDGGMPCRITLYSVCGVNSQEQSFEVVCNLMIAWRDPIVLEKLGPKSDPGTLRVEDGSVKGAFVASRAELEEASPRTIPDFAILNVMQKEELKFMGYVAPSLGFVRAEFVFKAKIFDPLDAHNYPYDVQDFRINIQLLPNAAFPKRRFVKVDHDALWGDSPVGSFLHEFHPAAPDWWFHPQSLSFTVTTGVDWDANATWRFTAARISFQVEMNYVLPIIIVELVGVGTFVVPPSELADRMCMSLGITLLLTLMSLRFVAASSLPNLPYLTMIDKKFIFALVFLAIVIALQITSYLMNLSRGTDAVIGIVCSSVLVASNIAYFAVKRYLVRKSRNAARCVVPNDSK